MTKKRILKIPFDKYGLVPIVLTGPHITWVENYVFEDELIYTGYSKGRSSIGFIFKSVRDKKEYSMFLSDFDDFLRNGRFTCSVNGFVIVGKFTFRKKGTAFGLVSI